MVEQAVQVVQAELVAQAVPVELVLESVVVLVQVPVNTRSQ